MNHERCRLNPNMYRHYAERLGALAINTVQTVRHEIAPPKPQPLPIPTSELVILDDETAVIRISDD